MFDVHWRSTTLVSIWTALPEFFGGHFGSVTKPLDSCLRISSLTGANPIRNRPRPPGAMGFFEAIIGTVLNVVFSLIVRVASGERRPKVSPRVTTSQSSREHEAIVSTPPYREPQTRPPVIRDYNSLTPR